MNSPSYNTLWKWWLKQKDTIKEQAEEIVDLKRKLNESLMLLSQETRRSKRLLDEIDELEADLVERKT